jgi:hypothetical protein
MTSFPRRVLAALSDDTSAFHGVTIVPVLSEEQLRAMAEQEWAGSYSGETWAAEDHEAWVQTFVEVGLMLSGKAIPH